MGLMDRVKAQAAQLASQAQQGVAQGQAKLTELQARRQADALLRNLGAAVYAAQRQGGAHAPVEAAMAALDAHAAHHGPIDTAPTSDSGPWESAGTGSSPPAGDPQPDGAGQPEG